MLSSFLLFWYALGWTNVGVIASSEQELKLGDVVILVSVGAAFWPLMALLIVTLILAVATSKATDYLASRIPFGKLNPTLWRKP